VPTSQLQPDFPGLPSVSLNPETLDLRENAGRTTLRIRRKGPAPATPLTLGILTSGDAVRGTHFTLPADTITLQPGEETAEFQIELVDNKRGEPDRTLTLALAPHPGLLPAGYRSVLKIADDDMPPAGSGTGWHAQFFHGENFDAPAGEKLAGRSDFDWDKKAPHTGLDPAKPYSLRWRADLEPLFTETYKFTVKVGGYGGARLWVGDKLVIDCWDKKGADSAFVDLRAGHRVPVRVEMKHNRFYGAQLAVQWSSPSQYLQPIPASQLHPTPTP